MSMRWWRIRRKGTAGLGLVALVLQLFLSFGHVHAPDPLALRALATVSSGVQAAADKSSSVSGQEQNPSRVPADNCPICSTMHLAASGLLPAPPSAAVPAEFAQFLHQALIEEFNFGVTRHILFQTRAPPIA